MGRDVSILNLEDDANDAELNRSTLETEGLACKLVRVETREAFLAAMDNGTFDVILADYSLPSFDGLEALELARERHPDVPFIFVSGALGEEVAIEALKHGATDYVLKDRLSRLGPAVGRALKERDQDAQRRRAERRSALMNFALDNAHEAAFLCNEQGRFIHVNSEACRALGYSRDELLAIGVSDIDPDFSLDAWKVHLRDLMTQGALTIETRQRTKDGRVFPVEIAVTRFDYEGAPHIVAVSRDITERKRTEAERLSHIRFLESMDKVNRVIQGAQDLDSMMGDVLEVVLEVFDCDRAFLLYPLDPDADTWTSPIERTKPEYPGVLEEHAVVPMDPEVAETFRVLLNAEGPMQFGPETGHRLPQEASKRFSFKSFMSMALRPKVGEPWQFGIHQCSHARVWSPEEERLLQEIGRRLADSLTSLLTLRQLRESERRYREVFENTTDMFVIAEVTADKRFKLLDCNPAWERTMRIKAEALAGKFIEEFISDENARGLYAKSRVCLEQRRPADYEDEFVVRRERRFLHTVLIPVWNTSGTVYRLVGVIRDVTEARLAQEELQRANDMLRAIIEAAPTAILGLDLDGNVQSVWNPAAERMFGWKAEEVMGRKLPTVPPQKQEEFGRLREQIRSGKTLEGGEVRRQRRDGTPIDCSIYASALHDAEGHVSGKVAVLVDITERKQMQALFEARLRLSEFAQTHSLEQLLQYSLDEAESLTQSAMGVFFSVQAGGETLSLQAWSTNTPEPMRPGKGKGVRLSLADAGAWAVCIRDRCPVIQDECSSVAPRGGTSAGYARLVRIVAVPVLREGKIVAILGLGNKRTEYTGKDIQVANQIAQMVWDIAERKKAEEERNRLAAVVEQTGENIVITDCEGSILYVNPAFERNTGYAGAEVVGKNPRILKSGLHDATFYGELWDTIAAGNTWTGHVTNKRKDGSLLEEETAITPIKAASGELIGYVAVKRDVTERMRLEEQLRQAQKMEALGTLAGGIAHDFNNILAALLGYAEILDDEIASGQQVSASHAKEILKAGERARGLVRQILAFSRKADAELMVLGLSSIVKETLKLLRGALPSTVEIRQDVCSHSDTILADPTQIHQVIMNLCTNAWQAMEGEGGLLEVQLKPIDLDSEAAAEYVELKPGSYLRLSVRDTGKGIDKEHLDRIFEPFFTTKKPGEGTGMGLAVVHGVVKSYGGAISVRSEVGEGTTFEAFFPRLEESEIPEASDEAQLPRGTERVLLVDDEEAVRHVSMLMLLSLGYHVTIREDGETGCEAFMDDPDRYDVILTDLNMPRMNGIDLACRLLEIRPGLPVVMCTGFGDLITPEKAQEVGVREVLHKPMRKRELAFAVRRVLDQAT